MLRRNSYSCRTITLMKSNTSISLFKTDNFIFWQRMTMWTTLILNATYCREVAAQMSFCLVSQYMVNPISIRARVLVRSYLHTISTMKHGLDGHQLAIDAGIHCVLTNFAMNLVCKIQCGSTFWKDYTLAFRCEDHDVIVVER